MPLEDNAGAPADSMAVGSSLKYFRFFFVFWNLKPILLFLKAQTLGKKKKLHVLFCFCFFFQLFQF